PEAVSSWSFVLLDPARLLGAACEDRDVLRVAPLGGPGFANIVKPAASPELVGAVRHLVAELEAARSGERPGHRAVVRGLVLAIMGMLHRLPGAEPEAAPRERSAAAEAIAPALDHLSRRYADPVGMGELAELCATSESNLRRMFRKATGRSPRDYLTYLRVQVAAALLDSTDLRVLDVAARVGYPTLSSFNRHFGRVMKRAPRQWRNRAAGD
ncbi:MAG TPA: helix-turn-helix transcriptional regulator, partial [Planctomycetota bacterium]|nr:helix-turn-helix transcriptional regulator [Planctomycetota bacterium]